MMESAFEKIVSQSVHIPHMHISIIIMKFTLLANLVILRFSFPQESIFKYEWMIP